VDRACGAYGTYDVRTKLWLESLKGSPRRGWEDNIKTHLRERVLGVDSIHPAQDRNRWWALVNKLMNLRVP
jgi:hypothetical protein